MPDTKRKIGIIGFGNMGSAIGKSIKTKYSVVVFDKFKEKTKNLSGISVAGDSIDLVNKAEVIILAVKPQDFRVLLNEIKDYVKDKLIISIAAGITTRYIEKILDKTRVVRAMPNIGARFRKSVTCICKGKLAIDADLAFARRLFENIGKVQELPENMMNAATAVSGSGPGYYFYLVGANDKKYKKDKGKFKKDFIAELTKASQEVGFNQQTAKYISIGTGTVCQIVLENSGLSPDKLVKLVASRKGTTEAGLKKLKKKHSLTDAVKAAVKRAEELSRG